METESSQRQSKRSRNTKNANCEHEEDPSPVALVAETKNIKKLLNDQQQVDERDESAAKCAP